MSESQPKLQDQPEPKFYTPEPKQTAVIERHLKGESNRKIAREEGIDRETVSRILSQEQLVTMVAEQQSRLLGLTGKALDVYEEALDSPDPVIRIGTATKILESTGVLDHHGLQTTIDAASDRHAAKFGRQGKPFSVPFVWPPPPKRAPRKKPKSIFEQLRDDAV